MPRNSETVTTAPTRARADLPPVVVGGVFQTGLNLMRDLVQKGVRAVGVDYAPEHQGFRSIYGQSYLCPNPASEPQKWLEFMRSLSTRLGRKAVLIPADDVFVSAFAAHADALREGYLFSRGAQLHALLSSKEKQYELAELHGFPCPRSVYVRRVEELREFAASAQFPCLLKPRSAQVWGALPEGNPLRNHKVATAQNPEELLGQYRLVEAFQPEVVAQECIVGPDSSKYCYLSVYGNDGSRLGSCVVREYRAFPVMFGSASLVEPVIDDEIQSMCDRFLRSLDYAGLCEIEVKRDSRDGKVRLIEVNPRCSGTGDCAKYTGVEVGWLHYLDLVGERVAPIEASRFNFRHITLQRDFRAIPKYIAEKTLTWRDVFASYRGPLEFFDLDFRDFRVTARTVYYALRELVGGILRNWGLKR
jgi:predicted ATP-grasp superfamily ATP-dependent carboligase